MMKRIDTVNAVGHVLCHDMTRIIPGKYKGAAFKKGHVVTQEDIPVLLEMGKERLYIWEMDDSMLHENDAADALAALCEGSNMRRSEVSEGKIELYATCDGLFRVDTKRLFDVNMLGDIIIATRHTGIWVHAGEKLCGTRVVPLVVKKELIRNAQAICGNEPLLTLDAAKPLRAGVITTGSEVFHGRIQDAFTPVVVEKLKEYGIATAQTRVTDDEAEHTAAAIHGMHSAGAELIICTGGMSVDPDDRTPAAIRMSGAEVVTYGAPVLPGAMAMLAYLPDGVPVLGLPGCVMYAKATVFDLMLPYIAAGVSLSREDIVRMGCGGLCMGCTPCSYPNCAFGKRSY